MKQEDIVSFIRERRPILFIFLLLFLGGFGYLSKYLIEKENIELGREIRTEIKSDKQQVTSNKKENLESKKFETMVNQMEYKNKIGQILLTSLDGYDLSYDEFNLLKEGSVSGFLLFSKNIKDEKQLKNLTFEINKTSTVSASKISPIIAVDQEGGNVSRINWIDKTSQTEIKTEKEAYQLGFKRGKELKDMGIWMNFSPVVECDRNKLRIMPKRNELLFEQNYELRMEKKNFIESQKRGFEKNCKELALAMLDGYKKSGILGVAKHFPDGLTKTSEDPHLVLPEISQNREELDLEDYRFLIEKEIESLMVTHLVYPKIDNVSSSRSKVFIRDILRDELGFDGVVIVDDLSMGALEQENLGEFVFESVKNGGDLFIVSNRKDYKEVYEYLLEIEDGEFEERLGESVGRILRVKEKHKN